MGYTGNKYCTEYKWEREYGDVMPTRYEIDTRNGTPESPDTSDANDAVDNLNSLLVEPSTLKVDDNPSPDMPEPRDGSRWVRLNPPFLPRFLVPLPR